MDLQSDCAAVMCVCVCVCVCGGLTEEALLFRQGGLSKECLCVKVPASPLPLEMLISHLQGIEKRLGKDHVVVMQLPSQFGLRLPRI